MTSIGDLDTALHGLMAGAGTITALLTNGAASIFREEARPGAVPPYVIFGLAEPPEPLGTLSGTWGRSSLYTVRGVTTGHSALLAGTIDDRIATVLEDAAFAVGAGTVMYCRREQDVDYADQAPGGVRFMHRGGAYRIWTT